MFTLKALAFATLIAQSITAFAIHRHDRAIAGMVAQVTPLAAWCFLAALALATTLAGVIVIFH